jgi:hypothetical protein
MVELENGHYDGPHGRIQGVLGVRTPSGRKCPFFGRVKYFQCLSPCCKKHLIMTLGMYLTSIQSSLVGSGWSNKALVHCTKPKFSPEKKCFLQLGNTWVESYSQILSLVLYFFISGPLLIKSGTVLYTKSGPVLSSSGPVLTKSGPVLFISGPVLKKNVQINKIT